MKISKDMKISNIIKSFRTHYNLNIEIYIPKDKSNDIALLEIISPDHKKGANFFDIKGNSKISDIEDMFFDKFGIDVQIKNKDGSITDSDLTIYKIINNVKGYSLIDENKENNIKTKIDKESKVENILSESEVETRINEIDNLYIRYQKKEKYKDMIKLLSSMEEAEISCPSSEKILLHINNIMNKAHGISLLSVKKKKVLFTYFKYYSAYIIYYRCYYLCFRHYQ